MAVAWAECPWYSWAGRPCYGTAPNEASSARRHSGTWAGCPCYGTAPNKRDLPADGMPYYCGMVPFWGCRRRVFVRNKPNLGWREKEGKCFMGKGLRGIGPARGPGKTKPIPPAAEKAVGQAPPYVPLRQGRRASGPLSSARMPNGPIAAPGRWPCGLRVGRTDRAGVPAEIADCRLRRVREMPR